MTADPVAEAIAARCRELFGHLPPGEIGDDDRVELGLDDAQRFRSVRTARGLYKLVDGAAVRYRRAGGVEELVAWRDGVEIDATEIRGWTN